MNNQSMVQKLFCIAVCFFWIGILNVYAQEQKVTVELKNATLRQVFKSIEGQTTYRFSYRNALVDDKNNITISKRQVGVSVVLDEALKGRGLTYRIVSSKSIVVSDRKEQSVSTRKKQVSGTVKSMDGEPVIGANVQVKGTSIGCITDLDGNFVLDVPENARLTVSYIGYLAQEISTAGKSTLEVKLKEDTEMLDEVVVVGYGTQRRGNIATAVTTVKSEVLQNRPVQTISEALQGQVPGLNVTGSAAPGSAPSLQLRGSAVLNASNSSSPLILVDGVPADFNFLNPEDIESINVLKDAASSAIYGSRAANGVLLITTKRGKEGKAKFKYNGSVSVNTPMHMPKTLSSAQYARIMNEAAANMNLDPIYTEEQIAHYEKGDDPNRYPNTDWLDLVIQNSLMTRHGIEASGGTQNVKYLVSANMDHQTGVFPRTRQNVFNVRSSTDIVINRKFDIAFDMRYQVRDMFSLHNQQEMYKAIIASDPTMVAYYTDGTYGYNAGFYKNPLVSLYGEGEKLTNRHEASGLFKLNYEIIDGLKFTGIANVRYTFTGTESRSRIKYYKNFFTQEVFEEGTNSFSDRRDQGSYYNLQALLNYKNSFGLHNLDILAGYQQENEESDWLSGARSGYPTDLIWELNPGPKDKWTNDGNGQHWALASFIGRINYDYDNKYILSLSMRSDASSRFAKDYRWASFPSVAAAWRISQESFMEKTRSYLDDLKLRVSWGQAGNANGLGLYPSYTLVSLGGLILNNTYQQIAVLKSIGNEELTWERSEMFNVGIDAKFFNSRLNFTGEYYVKNTKDILLAVPVPLEYGFGNPNMNVGQVRNKGWELSLGWNDRINDFSYSISANVSDNRNEVVDLGDTGPWKGGTYTDVGLPFNSIYGYESMGLFQSDEEVANAPFQSSKTGAGDVRYKDQNGDNKIDANDRVVLGDPYAHFLFGLNVSANYKNFDLGMIFQGIGKKDRIVSDHFVRPFYEAAIFEHQLDYWTPQNTDAKYPRILNKGDGSHNYQASDYWMINAGYLRLKNLTLGYTIPSRLLASTGLSNVRLYFTANNVFTISDFVPGMDPEASRAWAYPFCRTYSFGLNVQF